MKYADREHQSRFGPYRLVRLVGSGGMGSVFEARDEGLGNRVALKLLHPHVVRKHGATERFLREGRAAARVRHPHIVQVFALGVEGDEPYLAMELFEGDDLAQLVARKGRLSVEEALDLVLPVVAAVAAAHDAGVIHRDLKPSNVCITRGPGGRLWPKVVDFGVSKVIDDDGKEGAATDGVIGTAAYMAPEQARSARNASFQSDQYSLAVLLYQCVTGQVPFSGHGLVEIVESVMTSPVVPPSHRADGVPSGLDLAVLRAMSRDPGERFPSVRAFGRVLLDLASDRTRVLLAAELSEAASLGELAIPAIVTLDIANTDTRGLTSQGGGTPAPTGSFEPSGWIAAALVILIVVAGGKFVGSVGHDQTSRVVRPASHEASPATTAFEPPPTPDSAPATPSTATSVPSAAAASPPLPARPKPKRVSPAPPVRLPQISTGENGAPILP